MFAEVAGGIGIVECGRLILHPTTAIAPTLELEDSVVVSNPRSIDAAVGVDAKVKAMLACTFDRQSPATDPVVPCARK